MNCPCCGAASQTQLERRLTERCAACGHQWRPQVARARTDYQQQSRRNDPATLAHRTKLDDRLKDIAPRLSPKLRVLEIGCAEGSLGARIMSIADVHYTGIELSADAQIAEKVLHRTFREPAANLRGEDFDLLLSFHVLEHIEDIAAEVRAWRALLNDRGTLILEVPNQAGHALLEQDPNIEHLHQFTMASLCALLQAADFELERVTTGHFESPVYNDSLRVIAHPRMTVDIKRAQLQARFLAALPGPFAAWGIGGDYQSYVEPWLDSLPLVALIDSNAERHGERRGGLIIEAYDQQRHGKLLVLICSLRFAPEIARDAMASGVNAEAIVYLGAIFSGLES